MGDRIPLGFKFKLRNTLQNFLIDDDTREVEFPDMILQQIDHIHNVIRYLTTNSEYNVYSPLWEAMQIFSLKYIFKVSIHTSEDGERGNLVIEKIPRKKQENHEKDVQDGELYPSTDAEADDDETSDSSQSPPVSPIHFLVPETKESIQTTKHKNKEITKEDRFVIQNNKIIKCLTPTALEKLLQGILDFLHKEEEGSLVFSDLTPHEARFVENFLGIYNRRQHFRSSLSPACVTLLKEIKKAFKQFDKLCKLEVTARYNVHTKTREVIFLKAPRFTRNITHQSLNCNIPQKTPKIKSPKPIKSLTIVNSNFQATNSVEDTESGEFELHVSTPSIDDEDSKNDEKEKMSMRTDVPKESGEVKLHENTSSIDNKDFISVEKERLSMTAKVSEEVNYNNRKWSLEADFKEIVGLYNSKASLSAGEKDNEILDGVIQDSVQHIKEKDLSLNTEAREVDTDNRAKPYKDAMDDKDDLQLKLSMDADVIKDVQHVKEKNLSLDTEAPEVDTDNRAKPYNDTVDDKDDLELKLSMDADIIKDVQHVKENNLSLDTEAPEVDTDNRAKPYNDTMDDKDDLELKLSMDADIIKDVQHVKEKNLSSGTEAPEVDTDNRAKPYNDAMDDKDDLELNLSMDADIIKDVQHVKEKNLSLDTEVPEVDTDNRAKPYKDAMNDKDDSELKLSMDADVIKDNVTNTDSFEENAINLGTINEKDAIDINDIEVGENDDTEESSMDGDEDDDEIQSSLKITDNKLIVSNKALLQQEIFEIAVPKDRKSTSPVRKSCARIDKPSATNSERFRARPLCARRKQLLQAMSTPLESDKALRMMRLMGWQGGALGARGEGLIEPIIPALDLVNRQGLGSNQSRPSLASERPRETKPIDKTIDKPQTTKPTRQYQEEPKKPTVLTPIENRIDFLKTLLLVLKSEDTCVSTITYKQALRSRDKRCYDNIVRMLNLRVNFSLSEAESALLTNIQIIMAGARDVTINTAYNNELTEIKITKTKGHDFINYADEKQWQPSQEPITNSDEERERPHIFEMAKHLLGKTKKKPKIVTIKNYYKKNQFKRHICEKVLDFLRSEDTKTVLNFGASLTKKYCRIVGNVRNCLNDRTMISYKNVREVFTDILEHAKLKGYVLDVEIQADLRSIVLRKSIKKHQERRSVNGEVIKHLINKYTDTKLLSDVNGTTDKPKMKISNNNSEEKPNISNAQVDTIESKDNINNPSTEEGIHKRINPENDLNSYNTVSYTFIDSVNTTVIDDRTLIESDEFFSNEFSKCIKTRKCSVKSKGSKEQNIQKPKENVLPLYDVKHIVNNDDFRRIDKYLIKDTIDSLCPHKENFEIELPDKENNNLLEHDSLKDKETSKINNEPLDFLEEFNTENSRQWYKRSETFLISEDRLKINRESKMDPNNNKNGKRINSPNLIEDCVDSKVNNATNLINSSIEALKSDEDCAKNIEAVDVIESEKTIESIEKSLEMNPLSNHEVLIGNQDCLDVVESKELINFDDQRTKLDKLQTGAGTNQGSVLNNVNQASNYNKDSDIMDLNQTNEKFFELARIETEQNNDEDCSDNKNIIDINKSGEYKLVDESCAKVNYTNKEDLSCHGSDKSGEFVQSDREFKVNNIIEVVKDNKDNLGHISEHGLKNTNIFNESDWIDLNIKLEDISNIMEENILSIETKHFDCTEPHQNDELVEIESELEKDSTCMSGTEKKSCTDLNQICTKHSKLEPIKAKESQKSIENDSKLKTIEAEANLEQNLTCNKNDKVHNYEEIIENNYKLNIVPANNVEEDSFKINGGVDEPKDPLKTDCQDLTCTTVNEIVIKNNTDELNINNKLDLRQGNEKLDDRYTRNIDNCQDIVLIESKVLSVETIQKKIQDLIGNISASEFLPLLKYHGVLDTGIVYGCHNRDTCLWLKRVFPDCSIVDYKSAIDNHKLKIKVTSLNKDSNTFFYLLQLYNKGLKCHKWKVVSEKHYNYYLQLLVEMDRVSFECVCDNNFSLSVGYDVAQFSIGW